MNKYRSEETAQAKNKNLDYLSDLKFRNINRLIEFSLKNGMKIFGNFNVTSMKKTFMSKQLILISNNMTNLEN